MVDFVHLNFLDNCSKLEFFYLNNNRALWSEPDHTKNGEEILRKLLINTVEVDLKGSPSAERIYKNLAAKQIQKVFRGYRVRKKLTAKKRQKELLIPSVMLIALSIVLFRTSKAYRSY